MDTDPDNTQDTQDTPRQKNARTIQGKRITKGRSVGNPEALKHSKEDRSRIFREAVERNRLSLADASKFGVSKVAFSRWLNGRTTPEFEVFVKLLELENEDAKERTLKGIHDLENFLAEMKAKVGITAPRDFFSTYPRKESKE